MAFFGISFSPLSRSTEAEELTDRGRRRFLVLLLAILALAAVLRLSAVRAEFWFDEIWSWEFARDAASPWQIVAGAHHHHDNNHKLNTLFLSLYPREVGWWWYRLHSLAAGLAAVGLAALVARQRGRAEAGFASLLVAVNYWLVLCSAEARGYALAVCFALLALYSLPRYLTRGGRSMLVLFWISAILGFSSHLTFLHCYLALALWSVYHLARGRLSPRAEIGQLLACHAVPTLFVIALYVIDIRLMDLGGGPSLPRAEVLGRLLSLGVGGPPSAVWLLPLALAAVVVLILGLRLLACDSANIWLFYGVAIVGSPALFLLGKPVYLFERYFLIPFVFFLLLLSYVLAALGRSSRRGAIVAVAIVLAIVAGSVRQVVDFERGGRGRFVEALAYIERETPGEVVHLSGDYDFRVHKFCSFYVPYLHSHKQFVYHNQDALPAGGADWLLVHRMEDHYPLRDQLSDRDDNAYRRVKDFRITTFGGWSWHVYRNRKGTGNREQKIIRRGNVRLLFPVPCSLFPKLGERPWRRRRGRSGRGCIARARRP